MLLMFYFDQKRLFRASIVSHFCAYILFTYRSLFFIRFAHLPHRAIAAKALRKRTAATSGTR